MNLEQPQQPRIAHKDNPFMNKNFEHNIFAQKKMPEQVPVVEKVQQYVQSAEKSVAAFEYTTQKQVLDIEKQIELPEEDLAEIRDEMGLVDRLREIGAKAQAVLGAFKEKVSRYFSRDAIIDETPSRQKKDIKSSKPVKSKEFYKFQQKEILGPLIIEAKNKRNELLEQNGIFSLSKVDFQQYFASSEFEVSANMEQKNVGNCYMIAAIHAMSLSPHYEMICRSSMKRLPDGSWQVRIPFMSEDGEIVTVMPEDLVPQTNKQYLKWKKGGGIVPDMRKTLLPVQGKEGLQVLEAAAIKQKHLAVNRSAAEGGDPATFLVSLGGDAFINYSVHAGDDEEQYTAYEHSGLDSISEEKMAILDSLLENFDKEIHIATVVGREVSSGSPLEAGHAYSVCDIDVAKQLVSLANPWNTSKRLELTFDQLKNYCGTMSAIRINSAKLLTNMKKAQVKASV